MDGNYFIVFEIFYVYECKLSEFSTKSNMRRNNGLFRKIQIYGKYMYSSRTYIFIYLI